MVSYKNYVRTSEIDSGSKRLTGFRGCGMALAVSVSMTALRRLPIPLNMSEKSPPRLKPKSLSSSFGGVAVLA